MIRKSLLAEWLEIFLGAVWGLLIPGLVVVLVWYGGHLYMQGKATIGDITVFQIYAMLLIQPVWPECHKVATARRVTAETQETPGK